MLRAKNREQKFRNFQRFSFVGSASTFPASFPDSPNVTCWRCGRAGHYAKYCKDPIPTGPNRFFRPPSQGTSQTLINYVDCLTFLDNASCVSDGLPVKCIKELDSNSCPDLGQIDTELGSKVFTEVLSHQSPNVKNSVTENISCWEQMGLLRGILKY